MSPPATNAAASGPRGRRLKLAALATVSLMAVATACAFVWWKRDRDGSAGPSWQPPSQTFLASPMNVQPVRGWRTTVTELGVPVPEFGVDGQSRFVTNADPFWSGPLVGYLGDRGYFLAHSASAVGPQWWLVGVDVRDGRRLFPPVSLPPSEPRPMCYLNGPTAVLCLAPHAADDVTASVIDADTGHVSYVGATKLRNYPAKFEVRQIGIYAVAATADEGVYGVGSSAETTWFVPGSGRIDALHHRWYDAAPPMLATQTERGSGVDRRVVFSLRDGSVIKPALDDDAEQQMTIVFPNAFVAETYRPNSSEHRVQFFNDNGESIGRKSIEGSLGSDYGRDLPVVEQRRHAWAVYSPDGARLLSGLGDKPLSVRLIGSKIYLVTESSAGWKQYDLPTGLQGKTCQYGLDGPGYVGTDGAVVVEEDGNPNVGRKLRAYDLANCDLLWVSESPVGSFRQSWRINTTLVQLSDDGTELVSLVAPSR